MKYNCALTGIEFSTSCFSFVKESFPHSGLHPDISFLSQKELKVIHSSLVKISKGHFSQEEITIIFASLILHKDSPFKTYSSLGLISESLARELAASDWLTAISSFEFVLSGWDDLKGYIKTCQEFQVARQESKKAEEINSYSHLKATNPKAYNRKLVNWAAQVFKFPLFKVEEKKTCSDLWKEILFSILQTPNDFVDHKDLQEMRDHIQEHISIETNQAIDIIAAVNKKLKSQSSDEFAGDLFGFKAGVLSISIERQADKPQIKDFKSVKEFLAAFDSWNEKVSQEIENEIKEETQGIEEGEGEENDNETF